MNKAENRARLGGNPLAQPAGRGRTGPASIWQAAKAVTPQAAEVASRTRLPATGRRGTKLQNRHGTGDRHPYSRPPIGETFPAPMPRLEITPTALPDVRVVTTPVHGDARGFFTELFHAPAFAEWGLPVSFVQDNHSRSAQYALRGLHHQVAPHAQGKLIRPITGRIFDVAVDIRPESPTAGQWVGVTLEAGDGRSLWIPPGFAHGFLVLSEWAECLYKSTDFYAPEHERALRWDDPAVGVEWPIDRVPTLAAKDAHASTLERSLETFP